jgi:hypothetical protein
MTQPSDSSVPLSDADMAKTYRHLRFVKALLEIDDPELERALLVLMDRLAKAKLAADATFPAVLANGELKSPPD